MKIPERYSWEAEKEDGTIITVGEDLTDCKRFSLIPAEGTGLPRHDIVGVPMVRRFGRGFIRALGGGCREYLHCCVCKDFRLWVSSTTGNILVGPPDFELYL